MSTLEITELECVRVKTENVIHMPADGVCPAKYPYYNASPPDWRRTIIRHFGDYDLQSCPGDMHFGGWAGAFQTSWFCVENGPPDHRVNLHPKL